MRRRPTHAKPRHPREPRPTAIAEAREASAPAAAHPGFDETLDEPRNEPMERPGRAEAGVTLER